VGFFHFDEQPETNNINQALVAIISQAEKKGEKLNRHYY
jgi:hypothetical protein